MSMKTWRPARAERLRAWRALAGRRARARSGCSLRPMLVDAVLGRGTP
jgi:hypothetical protein